MMGTRGTESVMAPHGSTMESPTVLAAAHKRLSGTSRCPQQLSGISRWSQTAKWDITPCGLPRTGRARRAHTSKSKSQSRTAPSAACGHAARDTTPRPHDIQPAAWDAMVHTTRAIARAVRRTPPPPTPPPLTSPHHPATTADHAGWDTDWKSSAIVSRVISAWSNAARLRTAPRRSRVAAASGPLRERALCRSTHCSRCRHHRGVGRGGAESERARTCSSRSCTPRRRAPARWPHTCGRERLGRKRPKPETS